MSDNLPREVVEANEHLLRDAQRWQAFPTDTDVERVGLTLALELGHTLASVHPMKAAPNTLRIARAALEAVKREEPGISATAIDNPGRNADFLHPATEKAVEVMRTNLDAVKREDR